ncbi:M20/M25/M40 family metallo-hydrolase [Staphylococcus sp. SQ8-PEA]|uniref:M20/M25/M40 family metallo-hydrolase n=1 Tax=Staphylococcus marylandisciuri TaxID=2981529 RepID=A0ABT2QQV3_9STAP|nr:M20/M25/M40 family metallo-hydrolase [Staphylococcus marylandisciuri]MCU5746333.1 M20/M25/M40 family metallo-hydrolase [Staphylococcus marylandisciuri]
MINNKRLLNTFIELVKINSETGNEAEIQSFLKSKLSRLGLEIEEDEAQKENGLGANNLVCTLPSTEGYEDCEIIYFTSHMDTVVPGKNVNPIIKEDGYVYSDGTTVLGADDKAGLATLIETIEVIQEQDLPHGPVQFVLTVAEEGGLLGAKVLNSRLLKAKYGYAVDASQPVGTTVIGAPYQAKINAVIYGKTAHASTPTKGISAINIAAKAISRMKLGQIDELTTANIGRFEGGTATNIVAEKVKIYAETRSHEESRVLNQAHHMQNIFEQTANDYGTSADVESNVSYPGFKISPEAPVTQLAMAAAKSLNLVPKTVIAGGGSDGSIFNSLGIPTVILGVGYENIHTTSERIAIDSLNLLTGQILKIIELNSSGCKA